MICVKENLVGKKFNMLTVISRGEDRVYPNSGPSARWWCKCDCGNPDLILVDGCHLKSGHTKSCGCLTSPGFNKWEFVNDTTIKVFFRNSDSYFLMDYEDLPKVNGHLWCLGQRYVVAHIDGIITYIHNVIMNDKYIDHIDNNPLNNCKNNLRKYNDASFNSANIVRHSNPLGYKGIRKKELKNGNVRYYAYISNKNHQIYLGLYNTLEEAARAYDAKAYELWGEFAILNFPEEYLKE